MWKQVGRKGRAIIKKAKKKSVSKKSWHSAKGYLKLEFSAYSCRTFQVKGENFLLAKTFQDLSHIKLIRYII